MRVIDTAIILKKEMDSQGRPQAGRRFHVEPAELYTLCNELQLPMAITSRGYSELENCKQALINNNWDIARAAMPAEIFGMRLDLNV